MIFDFKIIIKNTRKNKTLDSSIIYFELSITEWHVNKEKQKEKLTNRSVFETMHAGPLNY